MEIKEQIFTRYEHLKEFCQLSWDESSLDNLQKAFQFVLNVIDEKQFETGEIIVNHSLDVATIIAMEIGLEPDSVITGLLHNVMYAGLEKRQPRRKLKKHLGISLFHS